MTKDLTVALIAGGKSSRMGRDKSFVELASKPLIEHLMARVAGLGETILITNRPDDYAHLGLPMFSDVIPEKGSLGGIYSAIHHSPSEWTLTLACDMPFVSADLLRHMISLRDASTDVIVPRVENYPQGLHALYRKTCLDPIRAKIDADRLKVIGFYGDVRVRYLDEPDYAEFDAEGMSFFNVNTPEDLEAARQKMNLEDSKMDATLDTILARYQGRQRNALLPVLWDVQTTFGHIDAEAVHAISHTLRVPEADIYGVISFYTLFHDQPTGETIIRVCTDPSCGLAGADDVLDGLCGRLNIPHGGTSHDGRYTVEHSACLGMCEHAPAALVSHRGAGEVSVPNADADSLLNGDYPSYASITGGDELVLLDGVLPDSAQSLDDYGDYRALRHVLDAMPPDDLIAEVEASGLIGRGGAAFPTGMKWKFTRAAKSTPLYLVCNADESEPGTFKDRVLMEARPHLLLEGMALCAYAIGAETGILFIRGEYPAATARMAGAIVAAEEAGLLGEHILGTDFSFHVEIRRGGGAYICGEETALFEAIEGKRGFPRIKPPYPTTYGVFGQPTTINNVETLCAVPGIVNNGADWFKSWGTEKSSGSKLVSVSGHVARPGVYEIAPGLPLHALLDDLCGGVVGELQAVLMGGAAGTFLKPDEIDVPLTFEDLQSAGSTFGSGAVMVFNTTTDLRDVLRRLAVFFQHESCGKCFPCQLGTQRQLEILQRADTPRRGDRERLVDIGWTMTEASLCGLGQTAGSAVLSAIGKFPHLFA